MSNDDTRTLYEVPALDREGQLSPWIMAQVAACVVRESVTPDGINVPAGDASEWAGVLADLVLDRAALPNGGKCGRTAATHGLPEQGVAPVAAGGDAGRDGEVP